MWKWNEMDERKLKFRWNKEILWVSLQSKTIYLQEHPACLLLYFALYDDMLEYIITMQEKGYVIG